MAAGFSCLTVGRTGNQRPIIYRASSCASKEKYVCSRVCRLRCENPSSKLLKEVAPSVTLQHTTAVAYHSCGGLVTILTLVPYPSKLVGCPTRCIEQDSRSGIESSQTTADHCDGLPYQLTVGNKSHTADRVEVTPNSSLAVY